MELPGSIYWVDKVTRQKISKQKTCHIVTK